MPRAHPAPQLFLVTEGDRPLGVCARHTLDQIDEVVLGRGAPRAAVRRVADGRAQLLLTVPDRLISQAHARLFREGEAWIVADTSSRNGTAVNGSRCTRQLLGDGDLIEIGRTCLRFRWELPRTFDDPQDLDAATLAIAAPGMATLLPALGRSLASLARVAAGDTPVLLLGPADAGQARLARGVHALSLRDGLFVPATARATAEDLARAAGGTLFVDAVAADRVGPLVDKARAARARVVVGVAGPAPATALSGIPDSYVFETPPLRKRLEDLPLLAAELLGPATPAVTPAALRVLLGHDWPGNLRELDTTLRLAAAAAGDGTVDAEHLPEALRSRKRLETTTLTKIPSPLRTRR